MRARETQLILIPAFVLLTCEIRADNLYAAHARCSKSRSAVKAPKRKTCEDTSCHYERSMMITRWCRPIMNLKRSAGSFDSDGARCVILGEAIREISRTKVGLLKIHRTDNNKLNRSSIQDMYTYVHTQANCFKLLYIFLINNICKSFFINCFLGNLCVYFLIKFLFQSRNRNPWRTLRRVL